MQVENKVARPSNFRALDLTTTIKKKKNPLPYSREALWGLILRLLKRSELPPPKKTLNKHSVIIY